MESYYTILGCEEDSSYEKLKKAYQELALRHHPDKQTDKNNTEIFCQIDEAWKILREPELRKQYDAELLQSKLNNQPLIYETLDITDFEYEDNEELYNYMCRCGGRYTITKTHFESGESYICCDECSLVILINKTK